MEILISVKSRDMPATRIQKWFRVVAFLFACLVFSQPVGAANAVGGKVISYASRGRIVREDVVKILGGEKPRNIPLARGANVYLFDWKALERWRFKERDQPAGSVVLNPPPNLLGTFGAFGFLCL